MGEIANWNNHSFTVSADLIRGFTKLTVKGGSETETKESAKESYLTRKSAQPYEITLTALLFAATGCDVQAEAMAFVSEAAAGAKSYFYVGGQKLVPCQLMLVSADVSEIELTAGAQWVSCEVQLTLKQCAKDGAGAKSGGSGSKKKSGGTGGTGNDGPKGDLSQLVTDEKSYVTHSLLTAIDESQQTHQNALTGKTQKLTTTLSSAASAINYVHNLSKAANKSSAAQKTGSGKLASTTKPASVNTVGKVVAMVR